MSAKKKLKVLVGMSGGVDSSVSAALLKQAGYEVVGVFIRPWDPSEAGWSASWRMPCNWRAERREARRAAAFLDIPLVTFDASVDYKKKVIDYLIAEYKAGRTPNPDVMCNKQIKFGVFYDWAIKQGADFVATGHYCQNKNKRLAVSKDKEKDQTYFLWTLSQEKLSHILFPVGGYTKTQVRALAKKFGLPNAEKKDSQGLCFIGQIDFKEFLRHELPSKTGAVLNENGSVIGRHEGAVFFTLGERRGFEIFTKTPDEKPYFIIAKDIKKNTLTVAHTPISTEIESREVKIVSTNWITDPRTLLPKSDKLKARPAPAGSNSLRARVRYRQPLQECRIKELTDDNATIVFAKPQVFPAGQSLVIYDGKVCLGGGIIA